MSQQEGGSLLLPTRRVGLLRVGPPLAAGVLALVAILVLTIAFSVSRLTPIEAHTETILENAAPSVEDLSTARTELFRLWLFTTAYVAESGDARTASRDRITGARSRIDAALSAYHALPTFPGEASLAAEVDADMLLLDQSLRRTLDWADSGNLAAASLELRDTFSRRFVNVADGMQRVISLNTDQIRVAVAGVLESKRKAATAATLLGGLSILVAVVVGIFAVAVVTTLRNQSRLVDDRAQLLAARATELEAFAGRVAHDLKAPLAAIALRVMAPLRRQDLDPELRNNFDKLGRQVERMDHIIDGLLEFARAGANPAPDAHADLRDILDEVVSGVRPAAEAVNAELRVDPIPSTLLACTPGALSSVLSNLLENAVKFVVEGTEVPRRISVRVREHGNVAHVAIEDTGPGLPPGAERIIFEPFRRLAETRQPGSGLGLATVKKIIEAYKGHVGVDSTLGHGSSFWFEIPKKA